MQVRAPAPSGRRGGLGCGGGRPAVTGLRVLTAAERAGLAPRLREVVEYRKSGLSLNHVAGCPLDCGYCIRHEYGNFGMKVPRLLMSDEEAVAALVGHRCSFRM